MLNDTKHLSVQSFQRNQGLLEALNNFLIYLKLKSKGLDSKFKAEKIEEAKATILLFLKQLNDVVSEKATILLFLKQLNDVVSEDNNMEAPSTRLLGLDTRFKSLVSQFNEAKGKKRRFKSVLFRQNPTPVIQMLNKDEIGSSKELIDSLTELGNLIEDHLSTDTREVIGDI